QGMEYYQRQRVQVRCFWQGSDKPDAVTQTTQLIESVDKATIMVAFFLTQNCIYRNFILAQCAI
ncbi:hypothetical protein M5E39_15470, partial [Salmonella enterica]|nr:hypothetical protein [Salmonella enterica]